MTTTSKSIRFFMLSLFVISCCSSVFSFTNGKPTPVTDDELLAQLFMKSPSPYYRQFTYLYGQDVFETIIQDSEDCKGILQQLDGSRAINTHLTLTFLARQYPTVYAQVQKASLWEAIPATRLTYLLISRLQRLIKAEALRSGSILRKGSVQEQKAILRNLEQIQKFIASLYEEISIESKFIELVSYYTDLENQDTVKQVLQKSKSNNPKISSLISDEFVEIFHIDRSTLKVSLTSQSQTSKTESENPEKSSNSNLVSAEEQCVKNSNLQQIKLAQNLYSGNKKVTWSELEDIQKQTLSNQQAGVIFFKNIESSFSTGLLGKSGSKINQYKNVKLVSSKGEVLYDCTHTVIIISQADKSIVTFL